jgi:dihydropteroate synthase
LDEIGRELTVSIDTAKAEVARRALAAGAVMVNDVTALRADPELAGVVVDSGAYLCLMHMLGEPRTMQVEPRYDDVVSEVASFLEERLAFAVGQGIDEERICLDPGIGFGKTTEHNLELLARLDEIVALGRPVLVGASRKRFLGRVLGDDEALTGPVTASVAASLVAYQRGASLFRVHDVAPHVRALGAARVAA